MFCGQYLPGGRIQRESGGDKERKKEREAPILLNKIH